MVKIKLIKGDTKEVERFCVYKSLIEERKRELIPPALLILVFKGVTYLFKWTIHIQKE